MPSHWKNIQKSCHKKIVVINQTLVTNLENSIVKSVKNPDRKTGRSAGKSNSIHLFREKTLY